MQGSTPKGLQLRRCDEPPVPPVWCLLALFLKEGERGEGGKEVGVFVFVPP